MSWYDDLYAKTTDFFTGNNGGFSSSDIAYFNDFTFPPTSDTVATVTPDSTAGLGSTLSELVKSVTNPVLDVAKSITALKSSVMSGELEQQKLDATLQIAKSNIGAQVEINRAKNNAEVAKNTAEVAKANAELESAQSKGVSAFANDNKTILYLTLAGVAFAGLQYFKKG